MIRNTSIVLAVGASVASAQTSELYINQFNSPGMVVVQGGSVVRSWNTNSAGENALAIADTIRTAGNWVFGNSNGAEYDLVGNPLGPTYTIFGPGTWLDGTTDGHSYNYAVQSGSGDLYRFDRNWSNPQLMFNVGPSASGITYEPRCGTFWVVEPNNGLVQHIDQSGTVLFSFTATPNAIGIAQDPADGTLWVGGPGPTISQYDTAGTYVQSVTVPGIGNAYGIEFTITDCYADFNGDGAVNTLDVLAFINEWSAGGGVAVDCNCDGVINTVDILCMLNKWVAGC
jgi:hypothetical protein